VVATFGFRHAPPPALDPYRSGIVVHLRWKSQGVTEPDLRAASLGTAICGQSGPDPGANKRRRKDGLYGSITKIFPEPQLRLGYSPPSTLELGGKLLVRHATYQLLSAGQR
jgi:hypothetical protein